MRSANLLLALLVGTAVATQAANLETTVFEIDPGSMICSSLTATTQTPITAASPHGGGILFTAGGGQQLTTERCIANLGQQLTPKPTNLRAPLHCNDAEGELAYYAIATQVALTQGVWRWTEEGTNDVYLSTLECTATGLE